MESWYVSGGHYNGDCVSQEVLKTKSECLRKHNNAL